MNCRPILLASAIFLMAQGPCATSDQDGDGYTVDEGDCDDTDDSTYPGAPEACDGVDNDCDPSTPDNCIPPGMVFSYRGSTVHAFGEDNGRVEPGAYDYSAYTLGPEPFSQEVSGQLEHVHSAASQASSISTLIIDVAGKASAGGADDYGYGIGSATGESVFVATFRLDQRSVLSASWLITEYTCNDPATPRASVLLADDLGDYIAVSGNDESGVQLELDPGDYTLRLDAKVTVEMSGGGDAYPCGEATYQLLMQVMR